MTHIPAVGAFQGRKNKIHIKDQIFPLLSCHHFFSPVIGHSPLARAERRSPYMDKSFCLFHAHSWNRCPPLTSKPVLSREGDPLFLPRARIGSGSETCRWALGFPHPSRPVSHIPCTEGHPCLHCLPLPGQLILPPYGSIQHKETTSLSQPPFHASPSSSAVQKKRKGILKKAVLHLHFNEEYCVDSCNVSKRFVTYLRALVDNFKAEANN